MTKLKKALILGTTVLAIGATSINAFAANKPAAPAKTSVVCTVEDKEERLQQKKDILAERVKDGKLTQAQADEIAAALETNQATCDGTGSARIGQQFGAAFGNMNGKGHGNNGEQKGQGDGQGLGRGQGGRGLGNGGNCGN